MSNNVNEVGAHRGIDAYSADPICCYNVYTQPNSSDVGVQGLLKMHPDPAAWVKLITPRGQGC